MYIVQSSVKKVKNTFRNTMPQGRNYIFKAKIGLSLCSILIKKTVAANFINSLKTRSRNTGKSESAEGEKVFNGFRVSCII